MNCRPNLGICKINTEGTRFNLIPDVRKDCSKSSWTLGNDLDSSRSTNNWYKWAVWPDESSKKGAAFKVWLSNDCNSSSGSAKKKTQNVVGIKIFTKYLSEVNLTGYST